MTPIQAQSQGSCASPRAMAVLNMLDAETSQDAIAIIPADFYLAGTESDLNLDLVGPGTVHVAVRTSDTLVVGPEQHSPLQVPCNTHQNWLG